ncbi:MAG: HlyD family efflux transporter periplasmic adaptor subunit [Proteobacteria bacterium]|nr:MAG: HlyD family efflux transporter periplasmic adaptor subunit [Pseudomonadota bacterium]
MNNKSSYTQSLQDIEHTSINKHVPSITVILLIIIVIFCLSLFLPWIQTSFGAGTISTIKPEDRLQPIVATINGRIKQWYVQDGSYVHQGDKLVELVDLDPDNLERISDDIAFNQSRVEALKSATNLSYKNYLRQKQLYADGLTSQKELEFSQIAYQKNLADLQSYKSTLVKLESSRSKQQSQLITAIKDGYIVNTRASSGTEVVKVGDPLANFIPANITPAAEIYVSGNDIPLIKEGQKVRLVFDGWPSVQFSGWPSVAIGTFGGIVKIVDYAASKNGLFRVMVVEDPSEQRWPEDKFLRYGSQTQAYIQLGKVTLGYEIWRQINGFPVSSKNNEPQQNSDKK